MQSVIRLLFNLYPGEEKKSGLFLLLGLLWGIGSYGTLTLSEGLFIEKVGAFYLPKIYLISSFFLCSCSGLLLCLMTRKKISSKYLFLAPVIGIICSNLFLLCALPQLTGSALKAIYFFYRMTGFGFTILSFTTFWSFADQFFNLQDGKRCFCIFNAIIFFGDAIGSGSISWFIDYIGIRGILIIFTCCLISTIPLIFYISNKFKFLSEEHNLYIETEHSPSIRKSLKIILQSKFTLLLVGFYFLMQILAIATEYNYSSFFEKTLVSTQSNLPITSFISKCSLWVSLGNMCFALLAYSRIIKKIGINNIIIIAPVCFVLLFSVWLCKSSLYIAILAVIIREGVCYALDDNNLQLLISGIPNKIRNQIRILVESFIEPLGMLMCSFLCLPGKQIPLSFAIALTALLLVFLLRYQYPKAIFKNLSLETISFDKKMVDWIKQLSKKEKRQAELFFLKTLKSQSEKEQIITFEHLLKIGDRNLLPSLLAHLNKFSLPAKVKAVELLRESIWANDYFCIELLERWRKTVPHPAIKTAIYLYFAKHRLLNPDDIACDLNLYSPQAGLFMSSIIAIRSQTLDHPLMSKATEKLNELLMSDLKEDIIQGITILEFESNQRNIQTLIEFLFHPSKQIQIAAAKALASSVSSEQKYYASKIIKIIGVTDNTSLKMELLHILEQILDKNTVKEFVLTIAKLKSKEKKYAESIVVNLKKEIIPDLLNILCDEKDNNKARLSAARILGKIDIVLLRKKIHKLVKQEISVAYCHAHHVEMLPKLYPNYDLNLLTNALMTNYRSCVQFIIELLGISGSAENFDVLSRSLNSKNSKIKAQALESLEKSCSSSLYALIEPFMTKEAPHSYHTRKYIKSGNRTFSLKEILNIMSKSSVRLNQITAGQLQEELSCLDSVFKKPTVYEEIIKEQIEENISGLNMV
ncbi:MAG: hypothetical protein RSB82_03090 [Victivallaceae bacterium]